MPRKSKSIITERTTTTKVQRRPRIPKTKGGVEVIVESTPTTVASNPVVCEEIRMPRKGKKGGKREIVVAQGGSPFDSHVKKLEARLAQLELQQNMARSSLGSFRKMQTLFQEVTATMPLEDIEMLKTMIKNTIDCATNTFQLGGEGRYPDANSLESGLIQSKKVIPISVIWDSADPNQGKFSLLCRMTQGTFGQFDWGQDFLIGPNGWPNGTDTNFMTESLYMSETSPTAGDAWPMKYDPNYTFLVGSQAESFTMWAARSTAYAPYVNSTIQYSSPFGTAGNIVPISSTPGTKVFVTYDASEPANSFSIPAGTWVIHATHTYTAFTTQVYDFEVIPIDDTCEIISIDYNFVVSGNWQGYPSIAGNTGPGHNQPGLPSNIAYAHVNFYVRSKTPNNSRFLYSLVNTNGATTQDMLITYLHASRQTNEIGPYADQPIGNTVLPLGVVNGNSTGTNAGLASRIRPTAGFFHFRPTINFLNLGGSITMSVLERGYAESNFLVPNVQGFPKQLQEWTNAAMIKQNTAELKTADGAIAWFRATDVADYKYRDVLDTQKYLNSDQEQLRTFLLSGIVPPAAGSTGITRQVVQVGYVDIFRVYEILSSAQLLSTRSYVGNQRIIDAADRLLSLLPMVMENPNHLRVFAQWAREVGLKIYNFAKAGNNFVKKVTGTDAITFATRAAAIAAAM